MNILTLAGSPNAMGQAFGETCRDAIVTFYALRVENAIRQALRYGGRVVDEGDLLTAAKACIPATRQHHPDGFMELVGIAHGADLPIEKIVALGGLTDLRDRLCWPGQLEAFGGCSSFIVAQDHTVSGETLCGQTWDLATDNLPFVLAVHRKPDNGPMTWCLTTVGCLSLIGINEHGIAIGTTNVRTTDARPGVTYLSLMHKALSCRDHASAVAAVVDAQRAGGHYFYVLDGAGRATAIECSARHATTTEVTSGSYIHTNHCLVDRNQRFEGVAPSPSSLARQDRLTALISQGPTSFDDARRFLGDREGGANAICRDNIDGINTNGAVVMAPQSGRIEAVHGLPRPGGWQSLRQ